MAPSRLLVPDDIIDQREPTYSKPVADALSEAYKLAHNRSAILAETLLSPHLHEQMTTMQRVRLLYILGMATSDSERYYQALSYIDEALDLAIDHDDLSSATFLAYLGAYTLHNLQRFDIAARYYSTALDALRSQGASDSADAGIEFDILRGLATEAFLCARYGASSGYLRAARHITLPGDNNQIREGSLEWLQSMMYRWRGQTDRALSHALAAYDLYAANGNQIELSRLRIMLAGTLLDLAQPRSASGGERRDSMLTLAEPHMLHALASTHVSGDRAGEGLALLAYARYKAITGDSGLALATIRLTETIALELKDLPLLSQVHISRGVVFSACGEAEVAEACYRAALETIGDNGARAYVMTAQRALRHEEEMSGDL